MISGHVGQSIINGESTGALRWKPYETDITGI